MSSSVFDRETLLDLTVNIVPLAIMAFFFVVFTAMNPWGSGLSLERVLQFGIVGFTFAALAVLTYFAAKAIEGTEGEHEHETEAEAEHETETEHETGG